MLNSSVLPAALACLLASLFEFKTTAGGSRQILIYFSILECIATQLPLPAVEFCLPFALVLVLWKSYHKMARGIKLLPILLLPFAALGHSFSRCHQSKSCLSVIESGVIAPSTDSCCAHITRGSFNLKKVSTSLASLVIIFGLPSCSRSEEKYLNQGHISTSSTQSSESSSQKGLIHENLVLPKKIYNRNIMNSVIIFADAEITQLPDPVLPPLNAIESIQTTLDSEKAMKMRKFKLCHAPTTRTIGNFLLTDTSTVYSSDREINYEILNNNIEKESIDSDDRTNIKSVSSHIYLSNPIFGNHWITFQGKYEKISEILCRVTWENIWMDSSLKKDGPSGILETDKHVLSKFIQFIGEKIIFPNSILYADLYSVYSPCIFR